MANPERDLVPYNPERTLIRYNQERALVPLVSGEDYQRAMVRPNFYDSFNQRLTFRGRNDLLSFICLFKSFMGCGIFAMPAAFMHGGTWWTLMHLIAFAIILYGCIYMLINCAHILESRYSIPVLSYSQLGMTAIVHGPPFLSGFYRVPRILINFFQFFASICLCGLYVMFMTHNLCDVGHFFTPADIVDFKAWRPLVAAVGIILLLPCIFPYLDLFCILGIMSQLLALGLCFFNYVFTDLPELAEITTEILPRKDIEVVLLMCGVIMYVIEGISAVMPVENTMNNPRHLVGCPSIFFIQMFLLTALKGIVGVTGHMKYKHTTLPFITSNMPKDNILGHLVRIYASLSIFFTYPIQHNVAFSVILDTLKLRGARAKSLKTMVRVLLVLLSCSCVLFEHEHVTYIMGVISGCGFTFLGIIMPACIELFVHYREYGALKWRLVLNTALIILGLAAAGALTYGSVGAWLVHIGKAPETIIPDEEP